MKHLTALFILGLSVACIFTSCEQPVRKEASPRREVPVEPSRKDWWIEAQSGQVSFTCIPQEKQMELQLGHMESCVKPYGAIDVYVGIRCPAVLSAPESAPLSMGVQPDFRWFALSENPLPTDQINANPNTVLVLTCVPVSDGYRLATQRLFKAAGPAASWREEHIDTPILADMKRDQKWVLRLPWELINAGACPNWFDVSLAVLADRDRDVILTFPPENRKGPRTLINFVYSFLDPSVSTTGSLAMNTAFQNKSISVVDAYAGQPAAWENMAFLDNRFTSGELGNKNGLLLRNSDEGYYAVYSPRVFAGNFLARAEGQLLDGESYGLMLFKVNTKGEPDPGCYIRLLRTQNKKGQTVVRLTARNGKENKLEEWWQKHPPFFEYVLDDDEMGYDTLGFRFLRDARTGCIRAGYQTLRDIDGIALRGWIEFPTVADWDLRSWVIAPFVCSREDERTAAEFSQISVNITQHDDQDDRLTGFAVQRRPYTFSGVEGNALVVTFDPNCVPHGEKFVFWSEANYIPWWHIDDTCAVSYEFVEIWGGGTTWKGKKPGGCCEPMSDRLLRWSTVNVVEANDARIIVRWMYVLANAEYQWWGLHDTLRPVVEEEYCFYPDGTGVRFVTYHPVAGTPYKTSWNEISEPMLINRGGVMPSTCLSRTALSMLNLQGQRDDYTYLLDKPQYIDPDTKHWDEVIVRINLNHRPVVFESFSQSPATRNETFSGCYDSWWANYDNSWHVDRKGGYEYKGDFWPFAHWPISKIPYEDHTKSNSKYIREPGHTSIMGIPGHPGAESPVSWAILFGLSLEADDDAQRKTASWLYPGDISEVAGTCIYQGNDYAHRALTFVNEGAAPECRFICTPKAMLVRPVVVIKNWGPHLPRIVLINKEHPDASRYRMALNEQDLIIWLDDSFINPFELAVSL